MVFINFFEGILYFYFSFYILILCYKSRAIDPNYLLHFCNSNDSTNSARTNLAQLLSSLSNAARNNANGFFNSTTAARNSSTLYGLFLCRGDVPPSICQTCVEIAADESAGLCPEGMDFIVWYEECMLRYSDQWFFGSVEGSPKVVRWTNQEVRDIDRFDRILAATVEDIAKAASSEIRAKKFATREADIGGSSAAQKVYALAECVPALSGNDCYRCLRMGIDEFPRLLIGKIEGKSLLPSCGVRYRMSPFYNQIHPPPSPRPPPGKGSRAIVYIVVPVIGFSVLFFFMLCFISRGRAEPKTEDPSNGPIPSLQFDLSTLRSATNNFADSNKIGFGGFGCVYKGTLRDGQEIAVKRLSETSTQGVEEFKNEVAVVAKLQHRNLVKLIGSCAENKERMLVYEFVPNKSLDYFLFDGVRRAQLDWPRRYKIIKGIARALLYLHKESRLRIIHRDLKASNILLDENMNSKISDFGLARIIGENIQSQSPEKTRNIAGTYGYISPEYAMHGEISVKSDVFSFGVLLLEIISGKGNNSFYDPDKPDNLLTSAWKHWKDGKPMELMDPSVRDSYTRDEVSRCIQIGLLCVQEDPVVRPNMSRVVIMLNSTSVTLPLPQKTAFFYGTKTELSTPMESGESTSSSMIYSSNRVSITDMEPR